jgi:DNA (cytosine-5)-methyltransferase 1
MDLLMRKYNIGSDCSGVGAFLQSLNRLGIDYEEKFSTDFDYYARLTYLLNYGTEEDIELGNSKEHKIFADGVKQIALSEKEPTDEEIAFLNDANEFSKKFSFYYPFNMYQREIPSNPLDIYIGSFPCQSFSLSGKRKGEEDKRGILFYNGHEFINKNKPKIFILENVKGLLSDDGGKTFQRWLDFLGGKSVNGNPVIFPHPESVPYHIYHQGLNAKDYGVPQNRERIFIIGIRDDSDNTFSFPKPFHLKKRLKDVIDLEVDKKYHLSEKMINYLFSRAGNFNNGKINFKGEDDIASSITASSKSLDISDNILKVGNVHPSGNGMNGNVFSVEGISPSLTTNKGEGLKIQIAANRGRNPQNPKSRETGKETVQMLEVNENDVSNALTTVQKDNVVLIRNVHGGFGESEPSVVQMNPSKESGGQQPYKQHRIFHGDGLSPALDTECGRPNYLFNYNKNIIFNGINIKYNEQKSISETLWLLQEEIGKKEIESWGLRILETIREKEILQSGMHEKSIQGKTKKTTKGFISKIQQSKGTKENAFIIMRSLSKEKWERCSPYRRKSIKQCVRKLNESLQKLPSENSQAKINLQSGKFQYRNEGVRILQQALYTIQEIWKSNDNEISNSYIIRRLTVRECFRLMDFPETFDISKVSDSQGYKQAGNSIVVAVLAALIEKLPLK